LEIIDYSVFTKICLIASVFGLIISYSFFQIRHNNIIIGGIFGLAMMISFGIWMIGELLESVAEGEESTESVEYISHGVMTGFGIFLVIRFLWIRNTIQIESKKIEAGMTERRAREILNAIDNGEFLIRVKFIRDDSIYDGEWKYSFRVIDKYEPI